MDNSPDVSADEKPRGRPFEKGNPGRPLGSRNKTTIALEQMLEGQAEAVIAKVVAKALQGDRMAMRLVFERVMGSRGQRPLTDLELPPIESPADGAKVSAAVLAATSSGKITLGEGLALMQMIEAATRAFATSEFDKRITALEESHGKGGKQWGSR